MAANEKKYLISRYAKYGPLSQTWFIFIADFKYEIMFWNRCDFNRGGFRSRRDAKRQLIKFLKQNKIQNAKIITRD